MVKLSSLHSVLGWNSFKKVDRGVLFRERGLIGHDAHYKHKWIEDGVKYPFCLKCGMVKVDFYGSNIGCPVSSATYSKKAKSGHIFGEVQINISKYLYSFNDSYNIIICKKCGLIPDAETQIFRINKATQRIYIVNSVRRSFKRTIPCSLSDNEWLIKDILI